MHQFSACNLLFLFPFSIGILLSSLPWMRSSNWTAKNNSCLCRIPGAVTSSPLGNFLHPASVSYTRWVHQWVPSYSQGDHSGSGKSSQLGLYRLLPSWSPLSKFPTLYDLRNWRASGASSCRTSTYVSPLSLWSMLITLQKLLLLFSPCIPYLSGRRVISWSSW